MSKFCTTLELTDAERKLLHNALETYLSDYGHEEHELIEAARRLIVKLDQAAKSLESTKAAG